MSCPFKHIHTSPVSAAATISENNRGCTINKIVTFMQSSPDAAFLLDQEGIIVYRNKAAQLLFLTNVHQMSLCSIFSFALSSPYSEGSRSNDCWDNLAKNLTTSEPQHHDVAVLENDGTQLDFRMNVVKLPSELMGDANKDVFACAYVTPAHDYENEKLPKKNSMHVIGEDEEETETGTDQEADEQLVKHMGDVVQASLDPMFSLYENGTIGVANDPALHLFGYSREELVGKDIASICPTARQVQNILAFINAPSVNKQQITTATDKSGTEVSIQLGLSLNQQFAGSDKPVYFANMKDLTTLEAHKSEIEHKDTYCQAMINASFDSMFGIDQQGKILVVNEAACQAFGYAREEFIDSNISMICNERDSARHDKYLRRYMRTGEKRVIGRKRPLVARRKDGTEFHIELGVSEINLANGEKMFCGFVRDRTQERLDKQMLRRKEAVIQDEFFGLHPGDARGALKRDPPRCTQ